MLKIVGGACDWGFKELFPSSLLTLQPLHAEEVTVPLHECRVRIAVGESSGYGGAKVVVYPGRSINRVAVVICCVDCVRGHVYCSWARIAMRIFKRVCGCI